jgi:hypothetical protein
VKECKQARETHLLLSAEQETGQESGRSKRHSCSDGHSVRESSEKQKQSREGEELTFC